MKFRSTIAKVAVVAAVVWPASPIADVAADGEHTLQGSIGLAWEDRFSVAHDDDEAEGLAVSPDGTAVFVVGRIDSSHGTIAYEARTGARRWVGHFGSTPSSVGRRATAVAVAPDGSAVYATGHLWSPDINFRFSYGTVAYDPSNGARLWRDQYDGPVIGHDFARALAVGPAGDRVFVTGRSKDRGFLNNDYDTVAYQSGNGSRLWSRRFGFPGDPSQDDGRALAVSPDGRTLVVTGVVSTPQGLDFGTVAYDTVGGAFLWADNYDGGGSDRGEAIAFSPDGRTVFVSGPSSPHNLVGDSDYATVAYDPANGTRLWVARYDGPVSGADEPAAIAVAPDGSVIYVTGASEGLGTGSDYATVAYDSATGAESWVARYDGPASATDRAAALAAAADSSMLVVTGGSAGADSASSDFATVAHDPADGRVLWTARYDRAGAASLDEAVAVAIAPDSKAVFVAGTSGSEVKTIGYVLALIVSIDIVPGDPTNPVDPASSETIAVAILGDAGFDVTEIDPESLRFGPAEAAPAAEPAYGPDGADPDDVRYLLPDINDDGFDDVIVNFVVRETGIACGDTSATLTGATRAERPFSGSDMIATQGCD